MKALQWLGLTLLLAGVAAPSSAAEAARVDVILWFDTEDYLSPADDDACKRLATMLTEQRKRTSNVQLPTPNVEREAKDARECLSACGPRVED